MRSLTIGLWKEWRDHRGISVALVIALPVLVGATGWALLGAIDGDGWVSLALFAPALAHALFLVAVASEVFGGERRRGTLALLARLPAGLARALSCELLFYATGSALAIVWGLVVGAAACAVFGPSGAAADFLARATHPATGAPLATALLTGQLALGCWVLWASTFVPQGGAAVLCAPLLLALLGLPAALALREHDWLVQRWLQDVVTRGATRAPLFGALAVAALLPLAASHLLGARRLASGWSAAWRGLLVVVPITAGGYAYGNAVVARETLIDPASPRFRIESAFLGDGGRYLYVNACAMSSDRGHLFDASEQRTPVRPWLVDLADGSVRVVGRFHERWRRAYGHGRPDYRPPTVVAHLRADGMTTAYEAGTGLPSETFGQEMATEAWRHLESLSRYPTGHWPDRLALHGDAHGRAGRRAVGDNVVLAPEGHSFIGGATEDGRFLSMMRLDDGRHVLATWAPLSGVATRLRDPSGRDVVVLAAFTLEHGPGDRFLVQVRPPEYEYGFSASYLVEARTGRARFVASNGRLRDLVLEPDGSVVGVEDHRLVVRHRPNGTRDVLFPRPAKHPSAPSSLDKR